MSITSTVKELRERADEERRLHPYPALDPDQWTSDADWFDAMADELETHTRRAANRSRRLLDGQGGVVIQPPGYHLESRFKRRGQGDHAAD